MNDIVMLHGWGLGPNVWSGLAALLPEEQIHAPALAADHEDLAHWADALVDTLPARFVLLGWSLGAMLAMCLAQRHPQRVRGVVLLAASPKFVTQEDWPHGLDAPTVQGFREAFQRDPARTQQKFLALQVLGDAQRVQVAAALQASLADFRELHLARGLKLLAQTDLRQHRPGANLPALLIHGAHDALMPAAAARWLAEGWSASRIEVLPECGHAPFLSEPAHCAELIRSFLRALPD